MTVILFLRYIGVDGVAIFTESQYPTLKTEEVCASETFVTLLTSIGFKGPRAETILTMNHCKRLKSLIALCKQHVSITLCNEMETININKNSVALVRERTIPTERLPLVGEVSSNFCGSHIVY
jgi:hypothetical protein